MTMEGNQNSINGEINELERQRNQALAGMAQPECAKWWALWD